MFSSTRKPESETAAQTKQRVTENQAVNPWIERRVARRIPVSLDVTWECASGKQEGRLTDISQHGCFLETNIKTSVGEKITFFLTTPTKKWLLLQGEVAFCQPTVGFGMRFTEVSVQDETMLKQLIEFYS